MPQYVFKSKKKDDFSIVIKNLPNRPNNFKRIAKFINGEFVTSNPDLFLRLKNKFPYEVIDDENNVVVNYKVHSREVLMSELKKRGLPVNINFNRAKMIKMLEEDDVKKVKEGVKANG